MIVIIDRPGQLCNRLWAITPFIALCLKHNIKLYVAHFDDYSKYFENVNRHKNINIGLFKNYYSYRTFINFLKLSRVKYFSNKSKITVLINKIESAEKLKDITIRDHTVNFIISWHQPYDLQMIDDHRNEIKNIFSPKEYVRSYVNEYLNNIRKPETVLVGVHIRKGDYKTYLNGRYYYEDKVYYSYMEAVEKELKKINKKARFLLCSNLKVNLDYFRRFNVASIKNTTAIHDLYALSKCDYIIGPPSTFSMWASFYGNVPLKFIKEKNEQFRLSDFSPIVAQNRFKNGLTL